MAERRHVEAARGKEKLEIAKRHAAETIASLVGDQRLPKFVRALLNQAWADVLTLTLLRQGQESSNGGSNSSTHAAWSPAVVPEARPTPSLPSTSRRRSRRLAIHVEEAAAIARRLTSAVEDDEDDAASRTELTMRLKARVRLGEDTEGRRRNSRRVRRRSRRITTSCGSCPTAPGSNSSPTSRATSS
jgi:hypothetical protein